MKLSIAIILTIFFAANSFSQIIIGPESYTYPKIEPLKAAVSTSFIGTPNGVWSHIKIPILPRRIRNFKDDERIHFRYMWPEADRDKNEVVYLLSGFGADAKSPKSNFLGRKLARRGFHVIILPSIFTPNFVVAASAEGIVGEFSRDAWDYFHVMEKASQYVEDNFGKTFSKRHMVGYSYGALTAAFVAKIDKTEKVFNLSKEILINPPTDLLAATEILDNFFRSKRSFGVFGFYKLLAKVGLPSIYYRYKIPSPNGYAAYLRKLNLSEREKEAMVGFALQLPLPSVSNAIWDALWSDHGDYRGLERRSIQETNNFYFKDYLEKILLPYSRANHRPNDNLESINKRNSLYALKSYFQKNKNTHIIHNRDDFLMQKGDQRFFSETFGDRFILFPWGGHLGNLWHDQNLEALYSILENKEIEIQSDPSLMEESLKAFIPTNFSR